jgi:molybdopterin-synthase adenylyltransferase
MGEMVWDYVGKAGMNDQQLLRYSRHILLPQLDIAGQERLLNSRALIVGAGGLGSPVAMYLAAAGVGTIVLADGDTVDLTNLQRQILHSTKSVGNAKVASGKAALHALNPDCVVHAVPERLEGAALVAQVAAADVVLDCTDSFATRHSINAACVLHNTPLVSGAAIGFDGQVSVFDPRGVNAPCYACLYPRDMQVQEVACSTMGVFAPLTGIIGATQAAEAIKLIAHFGEPLAGRLLMLNALRMEWQTVRFGRDPSCGVCGIVHTHPT